MGDPKNTINENLHVDDARKSIFQKDPETGETEIHREMADGSWETYHPGASEGDESADE